MQNRNAPTTSPQGLIGAAPCAAEPVGHAARPVEERGSLEGELLDLVADGTIANAGRDAVRAQVERGIPVTFLRGEQVVKRHADGREEVLAVVPRQPFDLPPGVPILGGK